MPLPSSPPDLLTRIRGEYLEMPGLKLSLPQACRLWQLEPVTCRTLLEALVEQQVLIRTENGAFTSRGYR